MIKNIIFCLLWLFIGFVSAYDSYLTVKFRDYMYEGELNPIARWIMDYDNWDVSLFIGLKMAGTILALGILAVYYNIKQVNGLIVAFVLGLFQLWLLVFLHS